MRLADMPHEVQLHLLAELLAREAGFCSGVPYRGHQIS
jgi:hypothetical protein